MTQATSSLDALFRRAGGDIFRLAALLTPDQPQAAAAVVRAVRDLARTGTEVFDERRLVAALLTALPPARRGRPTPGWARGGESLETRALLADVASLPVRQRLALAAGALRALDPVFAEDAGDGLGGPALDTDRRSAFEALARRALPPDESLPPLLGDAVPEACRPARAALAHSTSATHEDPAIRGHLALCADCRAAAQAWRTVEMRVDEALRAALRDVEPPPGLAEQVRAAAGPQRRPPLREWLRSPAAARALVPLVVLLAIGALVWPRPPREAEGDGQASAAQAADVRPEELVRLALDRLYAPPEASGQAVWQSRYAIRWFFADASYADLEGTLWIDRVRGRHRVQLVHEDGGGPFELQLGDGSGTLWYSVEPRYAASLFPQLSDRFAPKVELALDPAQQRSMLQARLAAGAWALPAAYLRQAVAADELRSWGRRTADDGADLAVIGFRGASALGAPVSGMDDDILVLLSIDRTSGQLYEVRELIGEDAAEQTGRTVWRYLGGEWHSPAPATERAFDPGIVLSYRGAFELLPEGAASPELPIVPAGAVQPLVRALNRQGQPAVLPSSTPPGVTSAALIVTDRRSPPTVFYLGDGRRLAIRVADSAPDRAGLPRTTETEEIALEGGTALLRPGPAQRYEAFLNAPAVGPGNFFVARVSAQGFSRDEMLGVLRSLAPLSVEAVRSQAALFIGPQVGDRAAFDALLGALAEHPPPDRGTVSYRVETQFARHAPYRQSLQDPYHRPAYGGRPEQVTTETWTRVLNSGLEQVRVVRAADGTVFERSYDGPTGSWWHDLTRGEVWLSPWPMRARLLDPGASAAEQLLICGAAMAPEADGAPSIVRDESGWRRGSCALPSYADLIEAQSALVLRRSDGGTITVSAPISARYDSAPFVIDLPDTNLVTQLWLGADGRVRRSEVSVAAAGGGVQDATVVERWELVRDEVLPAARVPAEVFQPEPPSAFMRMRVGGDGPSAPQALVALAATEARGLLDGELYLPSDDPPADELAIQLASIYGATFSPNAIYSASFSYDDPFEDALYHAATLRVELRLTDMSGGRLAMPIYQGSAERFGAFLRSRARWAASEPATLTVAGEDIDAWVVTTFDGRRWALAEIGRTLIAAPADTPAHLAALRRLEPR